MPKKNKSYDEFIREVRLNNLETIKRIFNTADDVTGCIFKNYKDITYDDLSLQQICDNFFYPYHWGSINSDTAIVMNNIKNDYQRKLYWKIWFESFAKAFERVENEVCGMSKKDRDKFLEWDTWVRENYIVKKINKGEKRYL